MLKQSEWRQLLKAKPKLAVSIYVPESNDSNPAIRINSRRLKGLIEAAYSQAIQHHRLSKTLQLMFEQLREAAAGQQLWDKRSLGLALFAEPDGMQYFHLPYEFREQTYVGQHYYLAPLMAAIGRHRPCYILALSQNHVQLWSLDDGLSEVQLGDMPKSLEQALWYKQTEKLGVKHNALAGSYHGQGADTRSPHPDQLHFVRLVERAVTKHLRGKTVPLILAGAEPTISLYRKVNNYHNLANKSLNLSPTTATPDQLTAAATKLVQQLPRPETEQLLSTYHGLTSTQPALALQEPAAIYKAAQQGLVDTLLFSPSAATAPGFGEQITTNPVTTVYDDLTDAAVRQTLLHGGDVQAMPHQTMPQGSRMAAILRYAP